MVRKITRFAICFAAGLFAITLGVGAFAADDKKADKVLDVEEIMKAGHSKNGYINKIKTATKGEKWEDAAKSAESLKANGEMLGKNKVEKGEADSWKKLSDKYAKSTAAVATAVEKKDAAAVTKALGSINCKECHDAHK